MNTRPKIPANARNLNCCIIGSSGSGKTRFWLTPQLLQAHSSYVVVDPKGGVLGQVGAFLQKRGYKIKVFNSIDFSKSMHYNPLAYIRNEADILKFVDALISNTKGEGKEGDPFWTKSETLLYCALIAYIIFEGPAEDRNMNTLVDMTIYRSGEYSMKFSKEIQRQLVEVQKDFMPEDTEAGQIQGFLEHYTGNVVCSKQLFKEALGHAFEEPKRWQLHNINEIMNTVVRGWKPFSNPRMFAGYGRQRGWEREISGNEPPDNEGGFVELSEEEVRQLELPKEWIA